MKRAAVDTDRDPPQPGGGLLESITRFWVTTLVIVAILYVAVMMISRSDGFRDIVQQRLSLLAGMPVVVEGTRTDPWLNLELDGVVAGAATNRIPMLTVGHASLQWRWVPLLRGEGWPFRRLLAQDATLRFQQDTNGLWQPFPALHAMVAPAMKLPGAVTTNETVPPVTEFLRSTRTEVVLEQGTVRWLAREPDEPPLAVVEGLGLRSAVIAPLGEDLMWFTMQVERAETEEVEWLRGVRLEWVRKPDRDVVMEMEGSILPEDQRLWQRALLQEQE